MPSTVCLPCVLVCSYPSNKVQLMIKRCCAAQYESCRLFWHTAMSGNTLRDEETSGNYFKHMNGMKLTFSTSISV